MQRSLLYYNAMTKSVLTILVQLGQAVYSKENLG